ncbi:hypothetical protein [Mammaliicoccus sciuri]|uniref:hypothetical protein n=1 Tax=Mammaliicoccus sciuri TaxID=1296 RepID=UPI001FB310FB|nr:hypothetical protein [Mammaliicoccus sciuri]MCJ1774682.1 hypothetical protein [Mammaliicoccus sciuri]
MIKDLGQRSEIPSYEYDKVVGNTFKTRKKWIEVDELYCTNCMIPMCVYKYIDASDVKLFTLEEIEHLKGKNKKVSSGIKVHYVCENCLSVETKED